VADACSRRLTSTDRCNGWHVSNSENIHRLDSRTIQSIAVLPLENLSADSAQEYFSEGLTDELITDLARIGTFRVVSRTSVVKYKGTTKTAPEIGNELHVEAIVEGTVERIGDRVRVRAQLIRAATDQHLWAESYDRDARDLLYLEDNLAQDIAQVIGHLAAVQRYSIAASGRVSAAAHENYLKGRYHWNRRTKADLYKGIDYFNNAIEQDPNYALAYAGLADSYIMLANWDLTQPGDAYRNVGIARRQICSIWRRTRSKASSPPTGNPTVVASSRVRGGRFPRERREWTACAGNCRPRWERPSMPGAKRSWSRRSDRSNKHAASSSPAPSSSRHKGIYCGCFHF